jgi:hypothetical protein
MAEFGLIVECATKSRAEETAIYHPLRFRDVKPPTEYWYAPEQLQSSDSGVLVTNHTSLGPSVPQENQHLVIIMATIC